MSRKLITKDVEFESALQWIDNAYDLKRRKVMLSADVDEAPVSKIVRAIHKMMEIDGEAPIDVYINSFGGSVYDGLALYDTLESLPVRVRTHALGKVCSMGFILYLVGDERFATNRARFMTHEMSEESSGTSSSTTAQMKHAIKEMEDVDEVLADIVEKRTTKPERWWKSKIADRDFWFGRQEAIEYGVVNANYSGQEE